MDVLKNKLYKSYDRLSRYAVFPYYYNTLDDKYVYGTTGKLSKSSSYQMYVVQRNDTYDTISLDFYNNPTYWWVICDFNNIRDPFNDPPMGKKLMIPVLSKIEYE